MFRFKAASATKPTTDGNSLSVHQLRMDNENLIRMSNRILFSSKAGGLPLIGKRVAGAGDPAATGDKPDVKR